MYKCTRCKLFFEIDEVSLFKKYQSKKLGLRNYYICRTCNTIKYNLWKAKSNNIIKIRNNFNAYYRRGQNAKKQIARANLNHSIKKGFIKKPLKCEKCNGIFPLEGHHKNYEKELDVIWLCKICHEVGHKKRTI